MKKFGIFLVFVLGMIGFQSCEDSKTYAELKEEEREAIKRFIEVEGIKVIDEDTYTAQDSVTNVANNEFVFFDESGVYMQIIERGKGEKMEEGRYEILARYLETKITEDGERDTLSYNLDSYWYPHPDAFIVTKSKNYYSASFDSYAAMMEVHSSNSVPAAWLIPFNHLRVGRAISARSKIRLIVPHSQGTSTASQAVAPCYYEITYQLGPGQ